MDFKHYQTICKTTAIYPSVHEGGIPVYTTLGLIGEVGEVVQLYSKVIRDEGGVLRDEHIYKLKKEIGDVLWFISAMCTDLNIDLDEIARINLDKLANRMKKGLISGSGDERDIDKDGLFIEE